MKNKIVVLLVALLVLPMFLQAQKAKKFERSFEYNLYPNVNYPSEVNSFAVKVNCNKNYYLQKTESDWDSIKACYVTRFEESSYSPFDVIYIQGLKQVAEANNSIELIVDINLKYDVPQMLAEIHKQVKAQGGKVSTKIKNIGTQTVRAVYKGKELGKWESKIEAKVPAKYSAAVASMSNLKIRRKGDWVFTSDKAEVMFVLGLDRHYHAENFSNTLSQELGINHFYETVTYFYAKGKRKMKYPEGDKAQGIVEKGCPPKHVDPRKEWEKIEDRYKVFPEPKYYLSDAIPIWENLVQRGNFSDPKAQYNTAIITGYYLNLLNANLMLHRHDNVQEVYDQMMEKIPSVDKKAKREADRLLSLSKTIKANRLKNPSRQ